MKERRIKALCRRAPKGSARERRRRGAPRLSRVRGRRSLISAAASHTSRALTPRAPFHIRRYEEPLAAEAMRAQNNEEARARRALHAPPATRRCRKLCSRRAARRPRESRRWPRGGDGIRARGGGGGAEDGARGDLQAAAAALSDAAPAGRADGDRRSAAGGRRWRRAGGARRTRDGGGAPRDREQRAARRARGIAGGVRGAGARGGGRGDRGVRGGGGGALGAATDRRASRKSASRLNRIEGRRAPCRRSSFVDRCVNSRPLRLPRRNAPSLSPPPTAQPTSQSAGWAAPRDAHDVPTRHCARACGIDLRSTTARRCCSRVSSKAETSADRPCRSPRTVAAPLPAPPRSATSRSLRFWRSGCPCRSVEADLELGARRAPAWSGAIRPTRSDRQPDRCTSWPTRSAQVLVRRQLLGPFLGGGALSLLAPRQVRAGACGAAPQARARARW